MSALTPYPLRPSRFRRAFTLLELLVAVALLGVIILGLLAMFTQVQRAWKSGITQVDVMEGGRATMALVVRDLQDMVSLPQTNAVNFEVLNGPGALPLLLDQVDGLDRTNWLQDLTFLKRSGDEWSGLAYRITNAAWGVGSLYRLTGALHPNVLTNYYTFPKNVGQLSEYLRSVDFPPNYPNELTTYNGMPISTPQERYYSHSDFARVLDGVVDFRISAYDANGVLLKKSVIVQGAGFAEFACTNEFDSNGVLTAQVIPAYIEVELAVLEPAVLERFNTRAALDATPNKQAARDYLRKKAGQVHIFRQRVSIRPAATSVGPLLPGS